LRLILFLLDSRRELTEEDRTLIDWAAFHQKPILVIFTKADKLSRAQRQKNVETTSLYYSIKDPHARIALIAKINGLLWD
jgi:GTP-binding protein EngB required for normal cell division